MNKADFDIFGSLFAANGAIKKVCQILDVSTGTVRRTLTGPVQKGYLTADTGGVPYIYLRQHISGEP